MQRNRLALLFLFVFVDLLGFSLILPVLPYYAKAFGATPTVVGLLVASNAAAQLVGAPIIGRLSDRWGRRPLLLFSIAASLVGFVWLGLAGSLAMVFGARMFDGLFGGSTGLAQAYISDITAEKDRARGFGVIGAAFGVGFIIGPITGGTLSAWGYQVPAFAAALLCLLNWIGVALWLPESLPPEQRTAIARSPRSAFSGRALWEALRRPCLGPLLGVRLFSSLAFMVFQTIFTLWAEYHLRLDARLTSYVLTYVGVLVVIVQIVVIGRLSLRVAEKHLLVGAAALLALGLLGWGLAPNVAALLVVLAPLALASAVLNTTITSLVSKAVFREEIGGTLGLLGALESLTGIVAPPIGGALLEKAGAWAPGVFAALVMAGVVAYILRQVVPIVDDAVAQCRFSPPTARSR